LIADNMPTHPMHFFRRFFTKVLFYFSAHWCGPCRRFTPVLTDLYKKLKARDSSSSSIDNDVHFEIVFCSMDRTVEEYKSYSDEMPWWCLPHESPAMGKLASLYGASGIPHLVILDRDGSVLIQDGVGNVSIDPDGTNFPWRPKPLVELLPLHYTRDGSNRLAVADLDNKYLMLYFSAHWCPPCKSFTPKLSKAYMSLKEHRDDFEVCFNSMPAFVYLHV
jgi:nucleoredoxin